MKSVATAILKNSLSAYLKQVRRGARYLVTDRGVPVAKLIPVDSREADPNLEERLAAMVAEGLLEKSPTAPPPAHKKVDLGSDLAARFLAEEREGW